VIHNSKEFADMAQKPKPAANPAQRASSHGAAKHLSRHDYKYDFLVFIGRFQPFHNGHKRVIDHALKLSRRVVILVGSARQARSMRNPFSFSERAHMIKDSYPADMQERLLITPLLDLPYADQSWIGRVQMSVQGIVCQYHVTGAPRIGLIGHQKDHTSYYLKMFPQWTHVDVPQEELLNATDVRDALFASHESEAQLAAVAAQLPAPVHQFLKAFHKSSTGRALISEVREIIAYRALWSSAPYPPVFVTVDAVVVQSGHILLVRRRHAPGKGQWALPGGFINQSERLEDAVIRELREETRISVPAPVLKGCVQGRHIFDDPYRSSRGRTITTAFLIELAGQTDGLPKVRGGDDADRATWLPIADIDPELMFEDHFHIIQHMLGESFDPLARLQN
jgi:bifunctional NMN adenylyltransferase/nudix hydrolase